MHLQCCIWQRLFFISAAFFSSVSNKEKDLIGQEQLKGLKAEDLSYYQVLIDQRDFPFMVRMFAAM